MEENKLEEGNAMCNKALECERSADTYATIAEYSMQYQLFPTALYCYEEVKKLEPEYPDIDRQLALLYLTIGDHENFEKYNRLCGNQIDLHSILRDIDEMDPRVDPELKDMFDHFKKFMSEHDEFEDEKKN